MQIDSPIAREQVLNAQRAARCYTPAIVRSIELDAPRIVLHFFPLFWIYVRFDYHWVKYSFRAGNEEIARERLRSAIFSPVLYSCLRLMGSWTGVQNRFFFSFIIHVMFEIVRYRWYHSYNIILHRGIHFIRKQFVSKYPKFSIIIKNTKLFITKSLLNRSLTSSFNNNQN